MMTQKRHFFLTLLVGAFGLLTEAPLAGALPAWILRADRYVCGMQNSAARLLQKKMPAFYGGLQYCGARHGILHNRYVQLIFALAGLATLGYGLYTMNSKCCLRSSEPHVPFQVQEQSKKPWTWSDVVLLRDGAVPRMRDIAQESEEIKKNAAEAQQAPQPQRRSPLASPSINCSIQMEQFPGFNVLTHGSGVNFKDVASIIARGGSPTCKGCREREKIEQDRKLDAMQRRFQNDSPRSAAVKAKSLLRISSCPSLGQIAKRRSGQRRMSLGLSKSTQEIGYAIDGLMEEGGLLELNDGEEREEIYALSNVGGSRQVGFSSEDDSLSRSIKKITGGRKMTASVVKRPLEHEAHEIAKSALGGKKMPKRPTEQQILDFVRDRSPKGYTLRNESRSNHRKISSSRFRESLSWFRGLVVQHASHGAGTIEGLFEGRSGSCLYLIYFSAKDCFEIVEDTYYGLFALYER